MDDSLKDRPDADFYSCDADAETLTHTSPGDAIGEWVDEHAYAYIDATGARQVVWRYHADLPLPPKVALVAYTRATISDAAKRSFGDRILERTLEELDEEYGNPDGGPTDPTPEMVDAVDAFLDAVLRQYTVWNCNQLWQTTIDVKAWIDENEPEKYVTDPQGEKPWWMEDKT